jgi:hypothetical protein
MVLADHLPEIVSALRIAGVFGAMAQLAKLQLGSSRDSDR